MANENSDYSRMCDQTLDAELEVQGKVVHLLNILRAAQAMAKNLHGKSSFGQVNEDLYDLSNGLEDEIAEFVSQDDWQEMIQRARRGE